MILLAEPEETLLAAKKKRQLEPSPSLTSSPKNRVWGFEDSTPGRLCSEPDLSWETAAGSVQYSYENVSGRAEFISRDPLSGAEFSQGTNLYAYCRNNFLNASDPTGMCLKNLEDLAGLASDLFLGSFEEAGGLLNTGLGAAGQFLGGLGSAIDSPGSNASEQGVDSLASLGLIGDETATFLNFASTASEGLTSLGESTSQLGSQELAEASNLATQADGFATAIANNQPPEDPGQIAMQRGDGELGPSNYTKR